MFNNFVFIWLFFFCTNNQSTTEHFPELLLGNHKRYLTIKMQFVRSDKKVAEEEDKKIVRPGLTY